MAVITRPTATAPPLRMAWLLLIVLLVLALAPARRRGLAAPPVHAAIPQGGAAVFTFASIGDASEQIGGDIFTVTGGRHRPAPADQRAWRQVHPNVVAGWHAHRLPRPAGRRRLGRRHGRGRRQPRPRWQRPRRALQYCTRGDFGWSPDGTSLIFPTSSACDMRSIRPLHRGRRRLVAGDEAPCPGPGRPGSAAGRPTGRGSPSWAGSRPAASACTWSMSIRATR